MIGAILAGGENRRIPYIKGLLMVNGSTITERNLNILKDIFERVVISTNSPEIYFPFGVSLIGDIINERGPMTGILSILTSTGADSVFIVACDMPFVKKDLIRYMKERFEHLSISGIKIDALIPRSTEGIEPLAGIYTFNIREKIEESLKIGRKGLHAFLKEVNAVYIEEEELKDIDPEGLSFINVNTLEDYERIGGMKCLV